MATWSQKTYVMVAERIRREVDSLEPEEEVARDVLGSLVQNLVFTFQDDNPDFKPARFREACGFDLSS